MARPVWTGAISFGMVSIPIRLVPAVQRKNVTFNRIDRNTGSRMRRREVAEATGEEVESDDIVKGFDLGGGNYVEITDEDLAPLAPAKSKEIDIESFVSADEVDPLSFDTSYIVLPDRNAKPYALLAQAMAGGQRVGIGRFVMRQKEYLAAIRSDGTHLTLSTLVFPDELVDVGSVEGFDVLDGVDVSSKELAMAKSLVDALSEDFDKSKYVDEYRLALESIIEQKAAGRTPVVAVGPAPKAMVIDLAAALEASLREAKEARGRHPSGHPEVVTVAARKRNAKADKAAKADAADKAEAAAAEKADTKRAPARVRKSA